jgi:hypothetical protein
MRNLTSNEKTMDNVIKPDDNIKRYCEVVFEIQKLNAYLDKERDNFYSVAYSFEEYYSTDLNELHRLEGEFIDILKRLTDAD